MGVLVSDLITKARTILNDKLSDNYTRDDISDLVDGTTVVFRANNLNILSAALGGPADPVVRISGVSHAVSSWNPATGLVTLATAPAAGTLTYLEYFFSLMQDADYIGFAQGAAEFVGLTPLFTLATQDSMMSGPIAEAAVHYMAHLGATKMANLSSWYYRAGAGDKNFDKAVIAQAFQKMGIDQKAQAIDVRDGTYTREGQRNAPAWGRGRTPFTSYTPPR